MGKRTKQLTHVDLKICLVQEMGAKKSSGVFSPALSTSSCCLFLCSSCSFLRSSSCCCRALSWAACSWRLLFLSSSSCRCRSSSSLCFLRLRTQQMSEEGQKIQAQPTGNRLWKHPSRTGFLQPRLKGRGERLGSRGRNLDVSAYSSVLWPRI